MCARQVSWKTDTFCGLCKKDKKISRTKLFFYTKFYLSYTRHKKHRFFMEGLCEHIEYRYVRANIFVQIIWNFKMFLNQNLNQFLDPKRFVYDQGKHTLLNLLPVHSWYGYCCVAESLLITEWSGISRTKREIMVPPTPTFNQWGCTAPSGMPTTGRHRVGGSRPTGH
jgi:hypothetical protein